MNKSFFKKQLILKVLMKSLIKLPSPVNLSIWWNFGSLLGICLALQLITGIFLSMHYTACIEYSFMSINHIMHDVKYGWIMRFLHMNGASFFFIMVYCHMGRGLYYGSYWLKNVWLIGVMIFILMMMTAFLGYVLPWGQMSYWGATVITNLFSVMPFFGKMVVEWLWGGFSVNNSTLTRFYSLHFVLPFILSIFVLLHLMYLHVKGSSNPLGLNSNFYKISFHLFFTIKDLVGMVMMILTLMIFILLKPYMLGDPENFFVANSLVTPIHIQPEWYFLFAYAILRSIPNKMSGVIALLMSILILMMLPFFNHSKFSSLQFYPFNQIMYWYFVNIFIMLSWLGAQEIEYPYLELSQIITILYFMYFFMDLILKKFWDMS